MPDESPPPRPGTPEANDLVIRDKGGDPVNLGTRMIERESYERVIEGLKLAADAAQHLAGLEPEAANLWRRVGSNLDQCRRISVQHAGLGLVIQENETRQKRGGDLMNYKPARARFREGLQQASGGMRQLATCFRNDIGWSRLAQQIEEMERAMLSPGLGGTGPQQAQRRIIVPPGYRQ